MNDKATNTGQVRLRFRLLALLLLVAPLWLATGRASAEPSTCAVPDAHCSSITVKASEYAADGSQGAALANYTFVVNVDNSGDPKDPNPLKRPGIAPYASHSPVV